MGALARKMVIESNLRAARNLEEQVLREVARHGYPAASEFAIRLALEEGLNNAIRHGNGFDPHKVIEVVYDVDDRQAVITITDQGRGFDPRQVPDPTADENLEKPCGRGIMLMRAYMDEVQFCRGGQQVRLIKRNSEKR